MAIQGYGLLPKCVHLPPGPWNSLLLVSGWNKFFMHFQPRVTYIPSFYIWVANLVVWSNLGARREGNGVLARQSLPDDTLGRHEFLVISLSSQPHFLTPHPVTCQPCLFSKLPLILVLYFHFHCHHPRLDPSDLTRRSHLSFFSGLLVSTPSCHYDKPN